MLSGLAPGSTPLRARHVAGALVAFAGAAAVMAARSGGEWDSGALWGFASALVAAVLWAGYSVLSRYFRETPSAAVALYCGATAAGSALAQIALVGPFEPLATQQWLAVAALGLGPVGLAFYLWDYGCKHGDIRLLGVSAYAAPLLSTLLLAALGLGEAGPIVWLAAAAIAGGALIAAR
jgi:drug/metabolite transporter (DMT)-like permease